MTDVVAALSADDGVTCLVGAGGKKTTLYALAGLLDQPVVTATVRIPIFDREVASVRVTDDPVAALDAAPPFPLGLVAGRDRSDRYRGYDPETVDAVADAHDGPVLVKADGARTREFKAPNDREPQLPASASTVIPVVSAHAVGKPLDETHVHRPERVAALADIDVGDEITPETVGSVVADEAGGLKDIPDGARAIPLVNKVDDAADERTARAIADAIADRADVEAIVLARMATPEVVDVV